MSKTFTLGEAQTLLPVVEALVRRAQTAGLRAGEIEMEMQALSQRIFLSGGMHVDVTVAARRRAEREKAVQEAKDTLAEIEEIGYWHSPEDGFAGRKPLDARFGRTERERLN